LGASSSCSSSSSPSPRKTSQGGGGGGKKGKEKDQQSTPIKSGGPSSKAEDYLWLECDDETIRILSESEFHSKLEEKDGALRGTPYVLFYHRLDTWQAK
jgi:hypothetical protein